MLQSFRFILMPAISIALVFATAGRGWYDSDGLMLCASFFHLSPLPTNTSTRSRADTISITKVPLHPCPLRPLRPFVALRRTAGWCGRGPGSGLPHCRISMRAVDGICVLVGDASRADRAGAVGLEVTLYLVCSCVSRGSFQNAKCIGTNAQYPLTPLTGILKYYCKAPHALQRIYNLNLWANDGSIPAS